MACCRAASTKKAEEELLFSCRCSTSAPIHNNGAGASLYPKAGCLVVGQTLYAARGAHAALIGRHLWETIITSIGDDNNNSGGWRTRIFYDARHSREYCLCVRAPRSGVMMVFALQAFIINGVLPMVHIRRIQRAFRRFLAMMIMV